jgi:4-hydroxy-tetrahydrodipicolinate reductase
MELEVAKMAKLLGSDFDVEIIEAHHNKKVDAPSGTAIAIGQRIAEAQGKEFYEVARFSRCGDIGERTRGEIGFSAIRGGSVNGKHTVSFFGETDVLSITHENLSRRVFAQGALRAAMWLSAKKPGRCYGMIDLIGDADDVR